MSLLTIDECRESLLPQRSSTKFSKKQRLWLACYCEVPRLGNGHLAGIERAFGCL